MFIRLSLVAATAAVLGLVGCSDPQRSGSGDRETVSSTGTDGLSGSTSGTTSGATQPAQNTQDKKVSGDKLDIDATESATKSNVQLGTNVDVAQYSYEKKDEFKNFMEARIEAVDRAIDRYKDGQSIGVVDGSGTTASKPAAGQREKASLAVRQVEERKDKLEDRLDDVDDVKQTNWDQFKNQFRNDLVNLERSYQDLLTANR